MVAQVRLGKVGAAAAREVSRFARNSRDWQQLIEMCRVVDAVLVDQEAVHAPRRSNDRLLLGLKGSLSGHGLDLLRRRSPAARRGKARRGGLIVAAPVGCVGNGDRPEKGPDRRVRKAIALVFDKVEELGGARRTPLWFPEHGLDLPAKGRDGGTVRRRPRHAAIRQLIADPVCGGACAYGGSRAVTACDGSGVRVRRERRPRGEWLALKLGTHERHVDWDRAEAMRRMVSSNTPASKHHGAAKHGNALLAGLARRRRCGRKLTVRHGGLKHNIPRCARHRGWMDNGEPRCIAFGGLRADDAVEEALPQVVGPGAVDAAVRAEAWAAVRRDEVREALTRDLEAARCAADRAFRQCDAADPANRLAAAELEARWEAALERRREVEAKLSAHGAASADGPDPTPIPFAALARDLQAVWNAPTTDARLRKRIARTLIHAVVADIDADAANGTGGVVLVVHWVGGVHAELRLPGKRRGQRGSTPVETVEAIRQLVLIANDDVIAGVLNRNGLRTGNGNRRTRERVRALRGHRRIPAFRPAPDGVDPWLNPANASALPKLAPRTLRLAAEAGEIDSLHPLPDGPWLFKRTDLEGPVGQSLATRAKNRRRHAATPDPNQKNPFESTAWKDGCYETDLQ